MTDDTNSGPGSKTTSVSSTSRIIRFMHKKCIFTQYFCSCYLVITFSLVGGFFGIFLWFNWDFCIFNPIRFAGNWKRKTADENVAPMKRSRKDDSSDDELNVFNKTFVESPEDLKTTTRIRTRAAGRISLGPRDVMGMFKILSDGASTSSSTGWVK